MRALASIGEEKRGNRSAGCEQNRMRCAPVAEHLSLAVIKMGRMSATFEPKLTDRLRKIAGVSQVHIDASRSTIQILYDGELGTVETMHRFVVATDAGMRDAGNRHD
jgi:hypothetical protein